MVSRVIPIVPAPLGRELDLTIECTSDPYERFGTQHRVIIHPDWTVETPHDLEAERIARSFGGWSTCLAFVERVVPAYRGALEMMTDPNRPQFSSRESSAPIGASEEDEDCFDTDLPPDPATLRHVVRREIQPKLRFPESTQGSAMAIATTGM